MVVKIGYTYNKSSNKAKNNKSDKQNNGEGWRFTEDTLIF